MVAVVGNTGIPLMPTDIRRARKLIKSGRARIYKHFPMFTIQLLDRETGETQPIEYCCTTGYEHVGISACSQKHEYVSAQYDLLTDETGRRRDRRKYRRMRRSRKRHRKPRFDNRRSSKKEGWLAPSIRNRMERQTDLFQSYQSVLPVTSAYFQMGQFDTQLLKALEAGDPVPEGADYQQGERYRIATLREAVFTRDKHTCVFCGRGIPEGAVLHVHHVGFWKGDHSDRMGNLATACEKCHTPKEHKHSGLLYGAEPKIRPFAGETFMTMVRWRMYHELKELFPDVKLHITYGAKTREKRREMHLSKSHVNDAYAMGDTHPSHRCRTVRYQKCRRNNRILEKFYDAKYVDGRDGSIKTGQQLFSGRSKRNRDLAGENLHVYRKRKKSKGRRAIRKTRYPLRPGDIVIHNEMRHTVKGVHCYGKRVVLEDRKSVSVRKFSVLYHTGGWRLS